MTDVQESALSARGISASGYRLGGQNPDYECTGGQHGENADVRFGGNA